MEVRWSRWNNNPIRFIIVKEMVYFLSRDVARALYIPRGMRIGCAINKQMQSEVKFTTLNTCKGSEPFLSKLAIKTHMIGLARLIRQADFLQWLDKFSPKNYTATHEELFKDLLALDCANENFIHF